MLLDDFGDEKRYGGLTRLGWCYASVLLLAGVLRFVGLHFTPHLPWARPDEEIFANVATGLYSDWNTHFAIGGFPEAYFRWHYMVQTVSRWFWQLQYGEPIHMGCAFSLAPWRFLIPVRYTSAAYGVGTVAFLMSFAYRIGPRDFTRAERHAFALTTGLFYATNVLAARDAHFAVSDTMMIFFFAWMLDALAKAINLRQAKYAFIAGVTFGIATSIKWTGLTFGAVPFIALVWQLVRFGFDRRNMAALAVAPLGMAVGFVGTSWAVIEEPRTFYDGLLTHSMRFAPNGFSVREGAETTVGWIHHGTLSFPFAMGWPLVVVTGVGCAVLVVRGILKREPMTFLVGFWTVFYYVGIVGRTAVNFSRYSLPSHPTAAVAAALLLVLVARSLHTHLAPRIQALRGHRLNDGRLVIAMAALLAAEPTFRSFQFLQLFLATDTREQAYDWIVEHVGHEPLDPMGGYARTYAIEPGLGDRCEELLPVGLRADVPRLYFPNNEAHNANRSPLSWKPTVGAAMGPVIFRGTPPPLRAPWLVVSRAVLPCDVPTVRYDGTDPPACFTLEASFSPGVPRCGAAYDEQDHFYAPLWGWGELQRMGPDIRIFRNECNVTAPTPPAMPAVEPEPSVETRGTGPGESGVPTAAEAMDETAPTPTAVIE